MQNKFHKLEQNTKSLIQEAMGVLQMTMHPANPITPELQQRVEVLENELKKINHKELSLAVVAQMKAGKSTVLNAFIGDKLLSASSEAMTTIPTKIKLDKNITEATLYIDPSLLQQLRAIAREIRQKYHQLIEATQVLKQKGQSHLNEYLQKSYQGSLAITEKVQKGAIFETLREVNHLVRLGICLLEELPFDIAAIVPPLIKAPLQMDMFDNFEAANIGSLVLIDTPGTNESSLDHKSAQVFRKLLRTVTTRQLREANVSLAIVDYANSNSQASMQVMRDVKDNMQNRVLRDLYVLVNKYDKEEKGDKKTLKDFQEEYADWFKNNGQTLDKQRQILGFSAKRALAIRMLHQHVDFTDPDLSIVSNTYVMDFLEAIYDKQAKRMARLMNQRELQALVEEEWLACGFQTVFREVIQSLLSDILGRLLGSGLEVCQNALRFLEASLQGQQANLYAEVKQLNEQIGTLKETLQRITIDRYQSKALAIASDNSVNQKIEDICDLAQLPNEVARVFGQQEKIQVDADHKDYANQIAESFSQHITPVLDNLSNKIRGYIQTNIAERTQDLKHLIQQELTPLLKDIAQKAQKVLNIDTWLILPALEYDTLEVSVAIDIRPIYREEKYEYWISWFNHTEKTYELDYHEVKKAFTQALHHLRDTLIVRTTDYNQQLQRKINDYFDEIKAFIQDCKATLEAVLKANNLNETEKKTLLDLTQSALPAIEMLLERGPQLKENLQRVITTTNDPTIQK